MYRLKGIEWAAVLVAVLLAANLVAGVALYSSASRAGNPAELNEEINKIKSDVASMRIERPVTGKKPYPEKRYSLLYKHSITVLTIVVAFNFAITLWVLGRASKKISQGRWTPAELREQLAALKESAAAISGLDDNERESLMNGMGHLTERFDRKMKK